MAIGDVIAVSNESGTEVFRVDSSGNVTATGTISTTGTDDFGTNGIKADVVAESSAAAGVTVDGTLIKDGGVTLGTGANLTGSATSSVVTNTVAERTAASGVTVDGTLIKDGGATVMDSTFYVVDNADTTKRMSFECSGISAGQTRTVTMPDGNVTLVTDPASYAVLAAVTAGNGAAKIGVEDSGSKFTAATVEAVLAEAATEYQAYRDQLVVATITVPDTAGGGTAALSTVSLKRAHNNSTDPGTICQIVILGCSAQYAPIGSATLSGTTTFGSATTGSIIASGNGWALVATDAAGDFACTISNSADETVYFRVITAEAGSDAGQRCTVVFSNSDAATWSA